MNWNRLIFALALSVSCIVQAAEIKVASQEEYQAALLNLEPGDTMVLANGEWRDFEIRFTGVGTPDQPITLRAETKGQVVISGESNLRLSGEHLLVTGLVFRNGYTPTNEVIAFRTSNDELANHSRVTEVVIDHYNNPERFERDYWVIMYGRHNRFDHNYLVGKSNAGVTMAVRLNSPESQENYHRIDHNYFGHRPILGSNGGETLRIGTSKYSLTVSGTTVENNFFERCNGEVEIISSKSGSNVFRGNVFLESRGTLTLRHGNDNLIENNIFLGNSKGHTGGIRVINKRQTVRNNYLSGLTGHRFGGGLVIMNGVPDSPINRYHQVEDSRVENNTIIDVHHIELAAGSDQERSAVPVRTTFSGNLIVNTEKRDSIAVHDDISGIAFSGNIADGVAKLPSDSGFEQRGVKLAQADNGLLHPEASSLASVGVARDLKVLQRSDTGPSWYPKPDYSEVFDSGNVLQVPPGQDTLTEALEKAGAGDVLQLQGGDYTVSKLLVTDRAITVRGPAEGPPPTIQFERTTLFELADGGSLKLERLAIDGTLAPDAYGNSVVRTSRYSMLSNYQLVVSGVDVTNLNTNHSFNFLKVSKHTFARSIEISNSSFSDVSGHVIALDREIDDLGIYNAEYINVLNSSFTNIGGAAVNIYRGGTDESTFGPQVVLKGSRLENVGANKRNKTRSSVFLLGVQRTRIDDNEFIDSKPVKVVHTVGDPVTKIGSNRLESTPSASVVDISEYLR